MSKQQVSVKRVTRSPHRESGMALLMALIVLVVVSILGLVALRSALFQNRVSINSQVSAQAFQAAESGLDVAMGLAATQSLGPDGVRNTADDLPVGDPGHIFNQALNDPDNPRRLCMTGGGVAVDAVHGVRNADRSLGFDEACNRLPGSVSRVTTVISESPDAAGLLDGYDIAAGAPLSVQIRAEGEVPGTDVSAVHTEDWSRAGPGSGIE